MTRDLFEVLFVSPHIIGQQRNLEILGDCENITIEQKNFAKIIIYSLSDNELKVFNNLLRKSFSLSVTRNFAIDFLAEHLKIAKLVLFKNEELTIDEEFMLTSNLLEKLHCFRDFKINCGFSFYPDNFY